MANTIAPHERAQTDSAMGPMRKGGMRFASASNRVSVGFTPSPASTTASLTASVQLRLWGGSQPMNADRMNGDRGPATERRGQADVDPSVIASAARGDAVAFGQIYAQIAPRVRRYVRTIIRNPWDAEDVTQDAFVKILTGIGHYDPRAARSRPGACALHVTPQSTTYARTGAASPAPRSTSTSGLPSTTPDAGAASRCGYAQRSQPEPARDPGPTRTGRL